MGRVTCRFRWLGWGAEQNDEVFFEQKKNHRVLAWEIYLDTHIAE